MTTRYAVTTANQPGAVAIIQVYGLSVGETLHQLTGRTAWPIGRLQLCDMAGIDEGLVTRLRADVAQLMPHGGPRVVQKLVAWLEAHGVTPTTPAEDAASLYPEARSPIEADMLHAIATAASPAAINRLAAQPALWQRWFHHHPPSTIRHRPSLDHLITPPTVVVVGRPNVGKSTLLNRLVGRSASVVADLPGTTRDWVGSLVELVPPGGDPLQDAIAVRWLDTPGLRDSDDTVEQRAIELARTVVANADVLITMRDPAGDWPADDELPRPADLRVVNKIDADGNGDEKWASGVLPISAATGQGIDALVAAVIDALGLSAISADTLWPFSPTLRECIETRVSHDVFQHYVGVADNGSTDS